MRVSILGTGYVGLVTGACLAEKGHHIICVDVDTEKINTINKGILPIHENGLEELAQDNLHVRLEATTDVRQAVLATDLSLIAVGTPCLNDEIDLTQVKAAAWQVGEALKEKSDYHLVVVKSTVVPGTTDEVVLPILERASGKKAGADFGVGMNPEFLTEGEAVNDFLYPDRIVLGGIDEKSINVLEKLYDGFALAAPRVRTNNRTAEMIKYTSNALLATMISFSNEMANLCTALGEIDIVDVLGGVHLSKYLSSSLPNGERIMPAIVSFLGAGCGFGGSCLPKDVKALRAYGKRIGTPMQLLDAVLRVNEQQPQKVVSLLKKHFPSLKGVRIALLGLAFRPDTNDMRESPAIPIIRDLLEEGAMLKAYDPVANNECRKLFRDERLSLCEGLGQVLEDVEAVILVTRWEEFRRVPEILARLESPPVFIDGRRMLDRHSIAKYEGIGL